MVKGCAAVFAAVIGVGAVWVAPLASADPGSCQFLGANYNVNYDCTAPPPWLPFGTGDNPPYGSQLPASDCTGINIHNVGCS